MNIDIDIRRVDEYHSRLVNLAFNMLTPLCIIQKRNLIEKPLYKCLSEYIFIASSLYYCSVDGTLDNIETYSLVLKAWGAFEYNSRL